MSPTLCQEWECHGRTNRYRARGYHPARQGSDPTGDTDRFVIDGIIGAGATVVRFAARLTGGRG